MDTLFRDTPASGAEQDSLRRVTLNQLKQMQAWAAHPDTRPERQKREQRKQLRKWWIALGRDDLIARA